MIGSFFALWFWSIVITIIVAHHKKLSIFGFGLLAFCLGPFGLLLVLIVPSNAASSSLQRQLSVSEMNAELARLKELLLSVNQRIASLEESMKNNMQAESGAQLSVAQVSPEQKSKQEQRPESFEFVFGKYWLSRIGVVSFVLGVAFFISYTFKYLPIFAKIFVGYSCALGFFIWGNLLEKKSAYQRWARGILGGAWGLCYVVTYALHYIDATRIIDDATAELILLALVSFGAISYNLKYRSWVVTLMTFLLAFITAGLGGIDYSTIVYCALVSASIIFVACRLDWYAFLVIGLSGMYAVYMNWIKPQIFSVLLVHQPQSVPLMQGQLTMGILTVSWILFLLSFFIMRAANKDKLRYFVTGSLLNAGFYVVLAMNELYRIRPYLAVNWDVRFWFLIAAAVIYALTAYLHKQRGKSALIVMHMAIALSLVALAIMIRAERLSVGFFWLIEMAIVFALGVYYKEVVYRVCASILASALFIRFFVVDMESILTYPLLGFSVKHSILFGIFCALCFYYLGGSLKARPVRECLMEIENKLYSGFILAATLMLVIVCGKEASPSWVTLVWALHGIAIIAIGFLLRERFFRICGLGVLSLACIRLIFVDLAAAETLYRIIAFITVGVLFVGASLIYARLTRQA